MSDGRTARSTWRAAGVKSPLVSVAKMIAAGHFLHHDNSDPRVVRSGGDVPQRQAGDVFVVDFWVGQDRQQAP